MCTSDSCDKAVTKEFKKDLNLAIVYFSVIVPLKNLIENSKPFLVRIKTFYRHSELVQS